MARTKQTREVCEAIVKDIASGLYAAQVALRNGLHRHTLQHWVERGLREGASELEAWFSEAYIKAEIEVEKKTIETIRAAAEPFTEEKDSTETMEYRENGGGDPGGADDDIDDEALFERRDYCKRRNEAATKRGDWGAAAWFAEKRWPKRWGSRAPMKGHETALDDMPVMTILEAAESRGDDLDELMANPTPELEEVILRNKEALRALIAADDEKEKG